MRISTALTHGKMYIRALGFWWLLATVSSGPAHANCGKTPQELAAGLPAATDAIHRMTLLMEAMDECGTGEQFDLMFNRQALAIGTDAKDPEAVTGTWISDMWLPVALGFTVPIIDVLTVEGGTVRQSLYRWFDPEQSANPEAFPKYVVDLAAAVVDKTPDGALAIKGVRASDEVSPHNRYRAFGGPEPGKIQHMMTSLMTVDLNTVDTIRVAGNQLLLAESGGRARTFSRFQSDILKGAHALFLVAEISAARYWRCTAGVLRGTHGNEQDREKFRAASRTALTALKLREEFQVQESLVNKAKRKGEITTDLEQTLKAKREAMIAQASAPEILAMITLFSGENLPKFCRLK